MFARTVESKAELLPLRVRLAKNKVIRSIGALFLTLSLGGTINFDNTPARPGRECWDYIEVASKTNNYDQGNSLPVSLRRVNANEPPMQDRDNSVKSAAFEGNLSSMQHDFFADQLYEYDVVDSFDIGGGLNVVLWSDDVINAHPDNFRLFIEKAFEGEYVNPNIQAQLYCFEQRLLVERTFEDEQINIYVPSDPNVCMQTIVMVRKQHDNACNASGVTLPNPSLFGMPVFSAQRIVVSPSADINASDLEVTRRFNKHFAHEFFGHLYCSLMHYPQALTPAGINYDEQQADAVGDAVIAAIGSYAQASLVEFSE